MFLNKIDLFAEKLHNSPLGDYFPDYTGGDNYDAACEYLLHRFVSLNQNAATKQIYAHYPIPSGNVPFVPEKAESPPAAWEEEKDEFPFV